MTTIICPYCKGVIDTEKSDKIDKYIKDKNELKDYPNCFNNFQDCPIKPIDENYVFNRCKMCPYYQYSDFKKGKEIKIKAPAKSGEEKALSKELQEVFKTLTKEQQEELLKSFDKPNPNS